MKALSKIIIFGASGFIGHHIAKDLSEKGHEVFAQQLPSKEIMLPSFIKIVPCDLRDPLFVKELPETCDTVIFLAQSPEFRNFPEGAESMFDINIAGFFRVIEYARKANVSRFIFSSTGSVYDAHGYPGREADPLKVTSKRGFYAASKLAAEILLQPYSELMSVIILRLFTPYGTGLNKSMLLPELVRRVRENIPIDLHGQNGMLINPIYIDDVTRLIENCLTFNGSITLNVAGTETVSLRELSMCIGDILGIQPMFNEKHGQAPVLVGDISRLRNEFGFSPKTSIREGLSLWLGK